MPGLVQPGERVLRGLEPPDRPGPGGGHIHIEGPGKSGLLGQEVQERGQACPQYRRGTRSRGLLPGGGRYPVHQECPALRVAARKQSSLSAKWA